MDYLINVEQRVASVVAAIAIRHAVKPQFELTGSLVDGGMTSVAMVELMLALEREFELTIPDGELSAENFFSIAALASLTSRLVSPRA